MRCWRKLKALLGAPQAIVDLLPQIGSMWLWEPEKPHARMLVRVTSVWWNDISNEALVESETVQDLSNGSFPTPVGRHWNDFSRWIEATVLVAPENAEAPAPKGGQ